MIALVRRTHNYTVLGSDALRLHQEAGYALFFADNEPLVILPIEGIGFHLWSALTVDDVECDGKFYVVANRSFYRREFRDLMGAAGGAWSRGKFWRNAVEHFADEFKKLVVISEDAPVIQQSLF